MVPHIVVNPGATHLCWAYSVQTPGGEISCFFYYSVMAAAAAIKQNRMIDRFGQNKLAANAPELAALLLTR